MSKQITPIELAEIVAGLLIDPTLYGELDSMQKYESFMRDIGEVVEAHCGGTVNRVNSAISTGAFLSNADCSPMLSVSPDESLPSLTDNVWTLYDPDGWEEDDQSLNENHPIPEAVWINRRVHIEKAIIKAIASQFSNAALREQARPIIAWEMTWEPHDPSQMQAEDYYHYGFIFGYDQALAKQSAIEYLGNLYDEKDRLELTPHEIENNKYISIT